MLGWDRDKRQHSGLGGVQTQKTGERIHRGRILTKFSGRECPSFPALHLSVESTVLSASVPGSGKTWAGF